MSANTTEVVSSAPAKVILFGEHGVNRQQPALATAVDLRTYCRVRRRNDGHFVLQLGAQREQIELGEIWAFRQRVDVLRGAKAVDQIRDAARDFFAPARYVLGYVLAQLPESDYASGLEIAWRSRSPVGAGLGSGAAATSSMVYAIGAATGFTFTRAAIVQAAWQGDIIAHGGVASSLDSSTATYGGMIRYTVAGGAQPLAFGAGLHVVIADTLVQHNTAAVNTHVRQWLDAKPVRMHHFQEMGWIVEQATRALQQYDTKTLGHLMNLHQLIQEKMGTSVPASECLIDAALQAGALGAKISGSGGGGIIIALVEPGQQDAVAAAIETAGGRAYQVTTSTEGVRAESLDVWEEIQA